MCSVFVDAGEDPIREVAGLEPRVGHKVTAGQRWFREDDAEHSCHRIKHGFPDYHHRPPYTSSFSVGIRKASVLHHFYPLFSIKKNRNLWFIRRNRPPMLKKVDNAGPSERGHRSTHNGLRGCCDRITYAEWPHLTIQKISNKGLTPSRQNAIVAFEAWP
jgi:hypothetical protein